MATKRFLIYDIIERLNQFSDDSEISPEHISFLIDQGRVLLLKQRFNKMNKSLPDVVFQPITINLQNVNDNDFHSEDTIVSSVNPLPYLVDDFVFNSNIRLDGGSYTDLKFIWTSIARFPYIGYNKLLRDIVYVTLGYDYKLKLKGLHNRYKLLDRLRISAVFSTPEDAWKASSLYDVNVNYLDVEYPLPMDLWAPLSEIIVKQLGVKFTVPEDKVNNAND